MADSKKEAFGGTPAPDESTAPPGPTIAELTLELERTRRELAAMSAKQSDTFTPVGDMNEQPAGKDEETGEQLYWYRIDLPPCGGTDIKVCGVPFYHGETYKVDANQLRSLRDMVARCWGHDAQIRGSNENAYRKPLERVLRGAQGGMRR